MKYVIGTIAIALGVLLVLKTEWFINNFGRNAWAEEKLGYSGGSRLMYKVIGLTLIFFGILAVTNMMSGFLNATIVKLFVRQAT